MNAPPAGTAIGEALPPYHRSLRQRIPTFALAGSLSVLVGLLPFPHRQTGEVVAAGVVFFVLIGVALLLPWRRLPEWGWPIIPVGFVGVIALIVDAQGNQSGLVALYILPIVWLAFYGRRSHLAVGLGAVVAALVIPVLAVGAPAYPSSQWRLVVVTTVVATLVSFSFLTMVARDRSYVSNLARHSLFAQRSARDAMDARERLDSLLRAATETAIIGAGRDGVISFFSAGAERMFGYRHDDVVERCALTDFLDQGDLATRAAQLGVAPGMGALAVGPASTAGSPIWTYFRSDGTRRRAAITVTTRPGRDANPGYVVVASDVTEREELDAERERLLAVQREVTEVLVEQNRRLRELTQMKDDVVATVSHELRTPLTSIRGFVELLLDGSGGQLDQEQSHMLRTIDRNSLQLLRVAEDLLSDPGGGHNLRVHFIDTDLALIATEAIDAMARQAATRRIELSLVTQEPVVVTGDPDRLHQLLGNLLSNAVKFTAPGGRVMVRVGKLGHFARLDVLDNGPGIPPGERPQLFERFYRLASATNQGVPGAGLGLAIAKSVVEAHDGSVDVVDTPGWSTTFRVLLPLHRSTDGPTPLPARPSPVSA